MAFLSLFDDRAEHINRLYVGLTRACKKLVLINSSEISDELEKIKSMFDSVLADRDDKLIFDKHKSGALLID